MGSEGGSDPVINYNNICNNGGGASGDGYGVYNGGTNTIDAQNNWWNDADGPNHPGNDNYPTLGDNATDYVDYDPWLSSQA